MAGMAANLNLRGLSSGGYPYPDLLRVVLFMDIVLTEPIYQIGVSVLLHDYNRIP